MASCSCSIYIEMREMQETIGVRQIRSRNGLRHHEEMQSQGCSRHHEERDSFAAATRPSLKGQPVSMSLRRSWGRDM